VVRLPISFIRDRVFTRRANRPPFVQQASLFEDFVIRCVRYAFANLTPRIGRVFFSRPVVLPFLRWRMLRHGYLRCPVHWREYYDRDFRGIWMVNDPLEEPDFVLYYVHGECALFSRAASG